MKQTMLGAIPEEMEDKWFIFYEDGELYFHRSWTGRCLYVVRFKEEGEGFIMYEADINRNPEQYRETDPQRDIDIVNRLIDRVLLSDHKQESPNEDNMTQTVRDWSIFGRM
jgi:hypothetical protein